MTRCWMLFATGAAVGCTGGDLSGPHPGGVPDGGAVLTSCQADPDMPSICTYWTCQNVPSQYGNKTHCESHQPPGAPHPPGGYSCPDSGGGVYCPGQTGGGSGPWDCHADEFNLTCDRGGQPPPDAAPPDAAAPPGSGCPTLGQQRWCDGPVYCGWGLQSCQDTGETWQWGACAEVSGRAPNTQCACGSPYQFNPQCCESSDCIYVGERSVPCSTSGTLCSTCTSQSDCATGLYCVQSSATTQFCTRPCASATDCPSGYDCQAAAGSPIPVCTPSGGTCP
jgi:hypothetical protein